MLEGMEFCIVPNHDSHVLQLDEIAWKAILYKGQYHYVGRTYAAD